MMHLTRQYLLSGGLIFYIIRRAKLVRTVHIVKVYNDLTALIVLDSIAISLDGVEHNWRLGFVLNLCTTFEHTL